jgi:hypothetical protein
MVIDVTKWCNRPPCILIDQSHEIDSPLDTTVDLPFMAATEPL